MKKYIPIIILYLWAATAYADTYCIVDQNGNVVNAISWDGVQTYNPPQGQTAIDCQTQGAGAGWTYSSGLFGGTFTPPAPQIPVQNPAQAATSALAAGLSVTSTGTPALNGVYGLDQNSQNNVTATTTYILLNGTFPGGGATMPWIDQNGGAHLWPNVAEFKAFATAYANYIANVSLYSASNGASGSLPSNTVTIP